MTQLKSKGIILKTHPVNAIRTTVAAFGVYAGLLGIEHGLFETLQGNIAPKGIRIFAVSGPGLPFPFGHEPAMTLVPNFLITGILAILAGLSIIFWSVLCVQRKHGAAVLCFLSLLLLLVGGGFGPISLLIAACVAASRINKPLAWWRKCLPVSVLPHLAELWQWSVVAALLWVPGEFVLGQIFHLKNDSHQTLTNLNLILSYPMLGLFALTVITAFAHQIENMREQRVP